MDTAAAAARLRALYENFSRADVARLADFYTADALFKDPFNEVRGPAAIGRIFDHMFEQVEAPRFEVHAAIGAGEQAFLTWTMHFRSRGAAQTIRGATHLRFAADGRVAEHRDYWDAAEELYEKLPVLGALMRWLRRKLTAH
ncbi:MAG: nuclear transport factor 2 family protein [Burkholderiales bacterium]|jgi:steroid delta-isomerase|nr:nuclear transport factor 2 family protein [Burkholderiales bacterium]